MSYNTYLMRKSPSSSYYFRIRIPKDLRRHEIFHDEVDTVHKFFTQIKARTFDPGDSPWHIRGNFGLFKCAQIPGVTSKFGIFPLEKVGPSWSVQIMYQFHIPRILAIIFFEKFDFKRLPEKFRFRNF